MRVPWFVLPIAIAVYLSFLIQPVLRRHLYIPEFAAILGMGYGVFLFYNGFRELWLKRLIEDIPTEKIATGAVGANVEIQGIVDGDPRQLVFSPISLKPCAFYVVEIYKVGDEPDPDNIETGLGQMNKIDEFFSGEGFIVTDASGAKARILPAGADIRWKPFAPEYTLNSSGFDVMPARLKEALVEHASSLKNFKLEPSFFSLPHDYRFVERNFAPRDPVYVLGYADTGAAAPRRLKLSFKSFLTAKKMIEADPALQKRFDANHDGVLDENELEQGAKSLGEQIEAREQLRPAAETASDVKMIIRKQPSQPFIISIQKEKALLFSLAWSSAFKLIGGVLIAVASAAWLFSLL